jgi:hypothetical protein
MWLRTLDAIAVADMLVRIQADRESKNREKNLQLHVRKTMRIDRKITGGAK